MHMHNGWVSMEKPHVSLVLKTRNVHGLTTVGLSSDDAWVPVITFDDSASAKKQQNKLLSFLCVFLFISSYIYLFFEMSVILCFVLTFPGIYSQRNITVWRSKLCNVIFDQH